MDRLQSAVGDAYRIESELGGGGMSRVFVAEEVEFGRKVVIKVLPPEMAAEVSVERFHREIQLSAKLQHPHVVSLLTAGSADDLLYYMMPYIDGESLRAKLNREGELPVGEAVRILKEVVDALAYAHRQGVVHRDIKPDNVLLSEGHALVTDFGVARAVTTSSEGSSLTSLGVALGTPAYMAPEQAAANPNVDHRADIYALGVLAYEMLSGRLVFDGPNPQAIMAAHVAEQPDPLTRHRSAVPQALNALVMRCLEKKAADRWQSAAELIPILEAMATPSGGMTPTGTQPVEAVSAETRFTRNRPVRVAGLYAAGAAAVLGAAYGVMLLLGLPGWVVPVAAAVLVLGLPAALLTSRAERHRATAALTGVTPTGASAIGANLSWRKTLLGGGVTFGGLAAAVIVYMAMRGLGIGPVGTLVASGVLTEQARVVLAEIQNRTADSTLGLSMTEALRVDLSQSPVIRLMDQASITDALERMKRNTRSRVDQSLAMEIAEREGAEAVVVGEIGQLGGGYVISARLLSAGDGGELLSERVTARSDDELIDAIDALSAKLRERMGESLRSLRTRPRLARVSTGSLDALRKYTESQNAWAADDNRRALALMGEAVTIDSGFAMAYRALAVMRSNTLAPRSAVVEATRNAFRFRDRLADRERLYVTAAYHGALGDVERQDDSYREILQRWPTEAIANTNLALSLLTNRRYDEAESLATRVGDTWNGFLTRIMVQVLRGDLVRAESSLTRFTETYSVADPGVGFTRIVVAGGRRDYGLIERIGMAAAMQSSGSTMQGQLALSLIAAALVQGKLSMVDSYIGLMSMMMGNRPDLALQLAAVSAALDVSYRDAPERAVQKLEAALDQHPLATLEPFDRPYLRLAEVYAHAGRSERAEQLLAAFEQDSIQPGALFLSGMSAVDPPATSVRAAIALAEGRAQDAVRAYRAWEREGGGACFVVCGGFWLGQAYELLGEEDSALVVYERIASGPGSLFEEMLTLGPTYRRLGELYETRGETDRAIDYYNRFVDLWKSADEELQSQVRDVQARIARLVGERGR